MLFWESMYGEDISLLLLVAKNKVEESCECHEAPAGGHFDVRKTLTKVPTKDLLKR